MEQLILLDDASQDAQVTKVIADFAQKFQGALRVEINAKNLGFVGTVNRAMALTRNDVCLLNSDTQVTADWLMLLERCAASDSSIASVTPFSNNATICSYPDFCANNPPPADAGHIARCLRDITPPTYPRIPTAVGFCMWIRRRALQMVGDFDQATFGRGYGEENDFCYRASGHGWCHALCDDAYVVHHGGASFSLTNVKAGGDNLARLLARYPSYNSDIAAFIAADPQRMRRDEITRQLNKIHD
jgi:GT2 family glycosyltransferase